MRRTIKPFTVEVKKGGRKSAKPVWPQVSEQSRVARPKALVMTRPEPAEPVRRVLPALDQSVPPAAPYRDPRRKPPVFDLPSTVEAEKIIAPESEPLLWPAPAEAEPVAAAVDPEAAVVKRRVRSRLLREDFSRSERWKARLPAVVFKGSGRRGG